MLKNVFGTYINLEAVGWVTYKQACHVDNVKGRDVVEVFSLSGVQIASFKMETTDPIDSTQQKTPVEEVLEALGYKG